MNVMMNTYIGMKGLVAGDVGIVGGHHREEGEMRYVAIILGFVISTILIMYGFVYLIFKEIAR